MEKSYFFRFFCQFFLRKISLNHIKWRFSIVHFINIILNRFYLFYRKFSYPKKYIFNSTCRKYQFDINYLLFNVYNFKFMVTILNNKILFLFMPVSYTHNYKLVYILPLSFYHPNTLLFLLLIGLLLFLGKQ